MPVLLLIGIGGSILGFVSRNTRPRTALLVTAMPAGIILAGCPFTLMN